MKFHLVILAISATFLMVSCSSNKPKNSISISSASAGLLKNHSIPFPLYLTDKIETKQSIIEKTAPNVFVIHTGHLLSATATKEQNIATLESLSDKGIDLVNLSAEDFIVAQNQEIALDTYPQRFLNSSVVDLNEDNIVTRPNITSYVIHNGVALIGLSDKVLAKSLLMDKFLVSDYVLAVLRAKKLALNDKTATDAAATTGLSLHSFVIIHTIGKEINEVMERLPPNFINSLAD